MAMPDSQPSYAEILSYLVGEQLSSVEFVMDYLQLRFEGPTLNVSGPIVVTSGDHCHAAWEPGFRDLLCGQIAKQIASVTQRAEEALVFTFEDGSAITVSLVPFDGCPEAVYFFDRDRDDWFAA